MSFEKDITEIKKAIEEAKPGTGEHMRDMYFKMSANYSTGREKQRANIQKAIDKDVKIMKEDIDEIAAVPDSEQGNITKGEA